MVSMRMAARHCGLERPFFTGALMRLGIVVLLVTAVTTGCVGPTYRTAVAEFGQATRAAVDQQSSSLRTIIAAEDALIRRELAENRVDLVLSGTCIASVTSRKAPECKIQRNDGRELRSAPKFTHIIALGEALASYSDNIGSLAADSSEDRASFRTALVAAAGATAKLDGALRTSLKIEGKPLPEEKIGTVAGIVADIGGLLLEKQRVDALKRVILTADPTVQQSVEMLMAAYDAERTYNVAERTRELQQAQNALRKINADPNSTTEERLSAQAKFIELAENYIGLANSSDRFERIGKAHKALATAARDGATKEDLLAGIKAVLAVAQSVGEAVPKLKD